MSTPMFPTAGLLQLPEEVLRLLFTHLEDEVVYLKVRVVCRQLKMYVDNYVQLGKSVRYKYITMYFNYFDQ